MNERDWISCEAFEVKQPLGRFYVAKLPWQDLLAITYADVRRINDESTGELDAYIGIQRRLSPKRVKEISEYVRTVDASFPNSIILSVRSFGQEHEPPLGRQQELFDSYTGAVPSETEVDDGDEGWNVVFVPEERLLKLRRDQYLAKIIDGQHRIEGLRKGRPNDEFDVIVTIFVDIDIADQANLFATINLAQTKVNKSLAYDLLAYARSRSPQRTGHNVAVVLDSEKGSPFYGKIKRLGVAEARTELITQATFVESLVRMISKNPARDTDLYKRGMKPPPDPTLPLREAFLQEDDGLIASIVFDFFRPVDEKWESWSNPQQSQVLGRSTGFVALMRVLNEQLIANRELLHIPRVKRQAHFEKLFELVSLTDSDITSDNYKPGTSGMSKLYRDLSQHMTGDLAL